MLTTRRELHIREGRIFMDWLPPIEVSPISDGGKDHIRSTSSLLGHPIIRYPLSLAEISLN
jgi:hypothetical protein